MDPGDVQLQTVQGAALGEVDPSKQKIHLRPIEAIFKEFNPADKKRDLLWIKKRPTIRTIRGLQNLAQPQAPWVPPI